MKFKMKYTTMFDGRDSRPIDHNIDTIRHHGSHSVGRLPRVIRADLMKGVKDGRLGHLKKEGTKPEVFYCVTHKASAIEKRNRDYLYQLECMAKCFT